MPVINIYLDEKLFEFVKKDKSRIVQQALQDYMAKQENTKPVSATSHPA